MTEKTQTTVGERIKILADSLNITQKKLAQQIGMSQNSITNIIKGKNEPGKSFIWGITQHYPQINIDWVLHGTGEMIKENHSQSQSINVDVILDDYRREIANKESLIEKLWKEIDAWRNMAMNAQLGKANPSDEPAGLAIAYLASDVDAA